MPLSITLNAPRGSAVPKVSVERGVKLALSGEGHTEAEISVTFLGDEEILELNRKWLQHDWVPDVLSFPLHPPGTSDASSPPMGDLYIGVEQAGRQAAENGVSLEEELVRLAIHGTLHILGYDHTEEEARLSTGAHFLRQEGIVREVLAGKGPGGRGDGYGGTRSRGKSGTGGDGRGGRTR